MLLIYLPVIACALDCCNASTEDTFYLSLNEESRDMMHWAEANATIPNLTEMTICHWEYISFFNKQFSGVWAYCVQISEEWGGIQCLQYFIGIDSEKHEDGKTFIFLIRFQNSSHQEYIELNI